MRALKIAFESNGTYLSQQEYCQKYFSSRLDEEKIKDCMQLVYYQVYCIYFEGERDPTILNLVHMDQVSRKKYLVITDYSLRVYFDISEYICTLLEAVFY